MSRRHRGKTFIHLYLVDSHESIRQVGGLPLVIPVGDESVVRDYVEMIDKLILTGGQNVHPSVYERKKTIESDDYNLVRDEFEVALLKSTPSE